MRHARHIGYPLRSRGLPTLAVVVPCYNEEEVLAQTLSSLRALVAALRKEGLASLDSYICFVDDGSRDRTWSMISAMTSRYDDVHGLKLTRNFGHQGAVLAGMLECGTDVVVTIDADLQDDERCIAEMLRRYQDGYDVVLGVRADRSTDTRFKRFTAELYYRALRAAGVRVVFNHADFRLMSREALAILREFRESNLFLRGLIPLIGLPSTIVEYARKERQAGESKYPFKKMLALAWEGVTSFSIMPLRAVAAIGAVISLVSLCVTVWALFQRLLGDFVPGWASTVVPMYFLGGVQILCLGIIGEYVGKIYMETKRRPRYSIEHDTRRAATQQRKAEIASPLLQESEPHEPQWDEAELPNVISASLQRTHSV
jgi:polyisoprenyl-phosphate glycosyltransferase